MFKYPLRNNEIYHSFIVSSENNIEPHQKPLSSPLPSPATKDGDETLQSELSVEDNKSMKSKKSNSHHRKKKEIIKPLPKQKSQHQYQKKNLTKQVKSLKTTLPVKNKQEKKPSSHRPTKTNYTQNQIKNKDEKQKKRTTVVKEKQNNSPPSQIHSATRTLESFSRQFLPAYSSAGKERQRKQESQERK